MEQAVKSKSEQLQTDLENWEYYLNDAWGRRVARDCGYTSKKCVRRKIFLCLEDVDLFLTNYLHI